MAEGDPFTKTTMHKWHHPHDSRWKTANEKRCALRDTALAVEYTRELKKAAARLEESGEKYERILTKAPRAAERVVMRKYDLKRQALAVAEKHAEVGTVQDPIPAVDLEASPDGDNTIADLKWALVNKDRGLEAGEAEKGAPSPFALAVMKDMQRDQTVVRNVLTKMMDIAKAKAQADAAAGKGSGPDTKSIAEPIRALAMMEGFNKGETQNE